MRYRFADVPRFATNAAWFPVVGSEAAFFFGQRRGCGAPDPKLLGLNCWIWDDLREKRALRALFQQFRIDILRGEVSPMPRPTLWRDLRQMF